MPGNDLHRIPDGDPLLHSIGGMGPTLQILMRRMTCVEGLEAALAPVFDALRDVRAAFAAQSAVTAAACRIYEERRRQSERPIPYGITQASVRVGAMQRKAMGFPVGPLAVASEPVDLTVGEDAAWCGRAIALYYADAGLAERPDERDFAAEEVSRFLAELAEGLHYERDADALATIDRARDRLEAWRVSGE
jgi:hypothetical protein